MDIGPVATPVRRPFARPKKRRRLPLFAVRANPPNYVLDFTHSSLTPERCLLDAVLTKQYRALSLFGLPGTGKTVIMRALAYQPSILKSFPDGICLISIPHSFEQLSYCLYEVLSRLGGSHEVKDIAANLNTPRDIMLRIAEFLGPRRILLLLDNVAADKTAINDLLLNLVDSSFHLTVVVSTRSADLARLFSPAASFRVAPHPTNGETAKQILCTHAVFNRTLFNAQLARKDSPCMEVLNMCCGLPLALAVAGGAVRRLLQSSVTPEAKAAVWGHYRNYLSNNFPQFAKISGLFSALASVIVGGVKANYALCALCVVQRAVWVPYAVLRRLWGLKQNDEVAAVLAPMIRFCVVTREVRKIGVGVVVPDVILKYARHLVAVDGNLHAWQWHFRLLQSYMDEFGGEQSDGKKVERCCSQEETHYLRQHLAFHLSNALPEKGATEVQIKLVNRAKRELDERLNLVHDSWIST